MLPLAPAHDEAFSTHLYDGRAVIAMMPDVGVLDDAGLGRLVEEDAVPRYRMTLGAGFEERLRLEA